jgi:hypothetical protein
MWQKCLGGANTNVGYSVAGTIDGKYVVAGSSGSYDGDISNFHGGEPLNGDIWVTVLDDTGALVWEKTYCGAENEEAHSIISTSDSGFILAGWTESHNGDITSKHDTTDFWEVKINDTGYIQWQKCLGGSEIDKGAAILQISPDEYIVTGSTLSSNGDITFKNGLTDIWTVKLGYSPERLMHIGSNSMLKVFPNPSFGKITVSGNTAPSEEDIRLSITNSLGQLCYSTKITNNSGDQISEQIDLTFMPPGMYVIHVNSNLQNFIAPVIVRGN